MERPGQQPNPLAALEQLVNKGKITEEDVAALEGRDAEAVKEIDAVLKFVGARPNVNGDIFVMQDLIEACAEELRVQIREMAEE